MVTSFPVNLQLIMIGTNSISLKFGFFNSVRVLPLYCVMSGSVTSLFL